MRLCVVLMAISSFETLLDVVSRCYDLVLQWPFLAHAARDRLVIGQKGVAIDSWKRRIPPTEHRNLRQRTVESSNDEHHCGLWLGVQWT